MKEPGLLIKNRMKATNDFRDHIYMQRRIWNRVLVTGLILLLSMPILLFLLHN